jgi:hypothetical protein
MKDVQCISELLVVLLKNEIAGYNQDALDTVYAEYDVPSDTFPDFDEHDFQNRLDLTKGFIIQMQHHDSAITRYVRGFADFYSLWAVIALNQDRLPDPQTISSRYAAFMRKVIALAKTKDMSLLRDYDNDAYAYLKSSAQAATEKPQRLRRHNILRNILLKSSLSGPGLSAGNNDTARSLLST